MNHRRRRRRRRRRRVTKCTERSWHQKEASDVTSFFRSLFLWHAIT